MTIFLGVALAFTFGVVLLTIIGFFFKDKKDGLEFLMFGAFLIMATVLFKVLFYGSFVLY